MLCAPDHTYTLGRRSASHRSYYSSLSCGRSAHGCWVYSVPSVNRQICHARHPQHSSNDSKRNYLSRRNSLMLSVAPFMFLDTLGSTVKTELSLWQQELQLYWRQLEDALHLGDNDTQAVAAPRPPMDKRLFDFLVKVPLEAAQQTLPGACGGCGTAGDAADADWFDFLSYIQFKAIARQLQPSRSPALAMRRLSSFQKDSNSTSATGGSSSGSSNGSSSSSSTFKQLLGSLLLAHIVADIQGPTKTLLQTPSSNLDVVRLGVRAILEYYKEEGFMTYQGVAFFGNSKAEPRNHEVWLRHEPAYVKYWLQQPATARSSMALDAEEGFSQDFIASTIFAYLDTCGLRVSNFRRYPSYSRPDLVAEQWTLTCPPAVNPSPDPTGAELALLAQYPPWNLDLCPGGDPTGCY